MAFIPGANYIAQAADGMWEVVWGGTVAGRYPDQQSAEQYFNVLSQTFPQAPSASPPATQQPGLDRNTVVQTESGPKTVGEMQDYLSAKGVFTANLSTTEDLRQTYEASVRVTQAGISPTTGLGGQPSVQTGAGAPSASGMRQELMNAEGTQTGYWSTASDAEVQQKWTQMTQTAGDPRGGGGTTAQGDVTTYPSGLVDQLLQQEYQAYLQRRLDMLEIPEFQAMAEIERQRLALQDADQSFYRQLSEQQLQLDEAIRTGQLDLAREIERGMLELDQRRQGFTEQAQAADITGYWQDQPTLAREAQEFTQEMERAELFGNPRALAQSLQMMGLSPEQTGQFLTNTPFVQQLQGGMQQQPGITFPEQLGAAPAGATGMTSFMQQYYPALEQEMMALGYQGEAGQPLIQNWLNMTGERSPRYDAALSAVSPPTLGGSQLQTGALSQPALPQGATPRNPYFGFISGRAMPVRETLSATPSQISLTSGLASFSGQPPEDFWQEFQTFLPKGGTVSPTRLI